VKDSIQAAVAKVLLALPTLKTIDRDAAVEQLASLQTIVNAGVGNTKQHARFKLGLSVFFNGSFAAGLALFLR
jgi:hypothetical protein